MYGHSASSRASMARTTETLHNNVLSYLVLIQFIDQSRRVIPLELQIRCLI